LQVARVLKGRQRRVVPAEAGKAQAVPGMKIRRRAAGKTALRSGAGIVQCAPVRHLSPRSRAAFSRRFNGNRRNTWHPTRRRRRKR